MKVELEEIYDRKLVLVRHSLFDLGNRLSGIEMLGADLCAVHDGVAAIQFEGIIQIVQSLLGHLITRVLDPSVCLHQDGGSEILIGVPPIRRTRGGAAGT